MAIQRRIEASQELAAARRTLKELRTRMAEQATDEAGFSDCIDPFVKELPAQWVRDAGLSMAADALVAADAGVDSSMGAAPSDLELGAKLCQLLRNLGLPQATSRLQLGTPAGPEKSAQTQRYCSVVVAVSDYMVRNDYQARLP